MKIPHREAVLSILVADDNEIGRLVLEDLLRRLGHRVHLASDGSEAVEAFRRAGPDIVLMDVVMPVIDGFEVARRIRAIAGRNWVPIIFVTDLGNEEDIVRSLQAGDDYMQKPVNHAVLGAKLRAVSRTLMLQRKLNDSLRRTQAIADSVVDAIITADEDGMICSCNRAAVRLFGYPEEELLGMNVGILMPEERRNAFEHALHEFRRGNALALVGERRRSVGLRKHGTEFPLELGISELHLDNRRLFVSVVRDISERKRVEAQLKENAARLQRHHDAQEAENAFARELLDKLLYRDGLRDARLQWAVEGAEHFSGDIVAAARSPAGGQLYVMLADATGHGLTATISLVPTLSTFYAMVGRNLPLSSIVQELNTKLRREMPRGRFVAAGLVCIDEQAGRGEIWMGGMPSALWMTHDGRVRRRFVSNQPALGIIEDEDFAHTEVFHWQEDSQIVMCSDGLFEAQNARGEPFGIERLVSVLAQSSPGQRWDAAWDALRRHLDGNPAQDDVSLVLVHCVKESVWLGDGEAGRTEPYLSAL